MLKEYRPHFTLKAVAEDIWIVDGEMVEMTVGPVKIPFTARMTVVRLQSGQLWCHSPVAPNPQLLSDLERLGKVAFLIAPNKLHHTPIKAWQEQFSNAKTFLAPGVSKRNPDKIEGQDLKADSEPPFANEIAYHLFQGSSYIQEAVFFHKASQTLILTDLIENIETEGRRDWLDTLLKLGGNAYPNGQTPRDLQLTFLGRKKQGRQSFEKLLSWQPKNVIISHGRYYQGNGTEVIKRAFRWL